jgi:hypothetical protein
LSNYKGTAKPPKQAIDRLRGDDGNSNLLVKSPSTPTQSSSSSEESSSEEESEYEDEQMPVKDISEVSFDLS